jgi:hypothetical protein
MNSAAMTLAAPKRPTARQTAKGQSPTRLPMATEILSMARPVSRCDEVSRAPIATARPQPAALKRRTARKPPPWYKILIANLILFVLVYGAYCLWRRGDNEKPSSTSTAVLQPPDDSTPKHSAPRNSGAATQGRGSAGVQNSPAKPSAGSEPVKPEDGHQETTSGSNAPTTTHESGWAPVPAEPKKAPEQNKEEEASAQNPSGPDMDPPEEPAQPIEVQPAPAQPAKEGDTSAAQPHVSFAGKWQTAGGAWFQIADDGNQLTIQLIPNGGNLLAGFGKLSRCRIDGPNATKKFDGTLDVTFAFDGKQRTLHTTASVEDDDHLKFRFSDWPYLTPKGKIVLRPMQQNWTRLPAPGR